MYKPHYTVHILQPDGVDVTHFIVINAQLKCMQSEMCVTHMELQRMKNKIKKTSCNRWTTSTQTKFYLELTKDSYIGAAGAEYL